MFISRVIILSIFLFSGCCFASVQHSRIHNSVSKQKITHHHKTLKGSFFSREAIMHRLMHDYTVWHAVKYKFGGSSRRGVDCSGYVQHLFFSEFHTHLPRTTVHQMNQGYYVRMRDLKPGDLVFFKTGARAHHVGVYIGHREFVNASGSKGVTRSDLYSPYWHQHYLTARRVLISGS